MARATVHDRDNRSPETMAGVEAVLRLPDPIDGESVRDQLEKLLHPAAHHLVLEKFRNFLNASLAPWRNDHPIQAPDLTALRPMLWACQRGHTHDGWDASPAWGLYFGTAGEAAQLRLRTVWHQARELKHPKAEQYDDLVGALAAWIIDIFSEAAEQQRARLEKRAERHGPVPRAQAAAALLERLPDFRQALAAYIAATKDPFPMLRDEVDRLERGARKELS